MPTITRAGADYEAEETLTIREPWRIKVLSDPTRVAICSLLRGHSFSVQGLSRELNLPKGTVGHHVKALERARLVHVVRTRPVRAVTEKFYGRTAWMFVVEAEDPEDERAFSASGLRRAAEEMDASPAILNFGLARARLRPADQRRFEARLRRLRHDVSAADVEGGEPCVLAGSLYRVDDV